MRLFCLGNRNIVCLRETSFNKFIKKAVDEDDYDSTDSSFSKTTVQTVVFWGKLIALTFLPCRIITINIMVLLIV